MYRSWCWPLNSHFVASFYIHKKYAVVYRSNLEFRLGLGRLRVPKVFWFQRSVATFFSLFSEVAKPRSADSWRNDRNQIWSDMICYASLLTTQAHREPSLLSHRRALIWWIETIIFHWNVQQFLWFLWSIFYVDISRIMGTCRNYCQISFFMKFAT